MIQQKGNNKTIFIVLGPLIFIILQLIDRPADIPENAYTVLGITIWMAIWWISEALPIAVTALLPIVLFPIYNISEINEITSSYGHKYIFLYIGGFLIAIAVEKWNLHKRIALTIINFIGTDFKRIILGFMLATSFLSMWISNTATTVMMLPIGMAIISQIPSKDKKPFGKTLMIAIAYSASIGGIATLIGTPPNLVLAGILEELYGVKLSFIKWLSIGLPISIILFIICWQYLIRFNLNMKLTEFPGGKSELRRLKSDLGHMSYEEKGVLAVFLLTAICWISRSFIEKIIPEIDDTIIAISGAILLFIFPSKTKGQTLLKWKDSKELPWGIVILFGGGIALAKGFTDSGLAIYLANKLTYLHGLSLIVIMLILISMVNFLTEVTSNLATTAMLLPILAPLALAFDIHPFIIMVPATIAASCAFMLPVATPPNAVVFGSKLLTIKDMAKTGFVLNLISITVITLFCYILLPILWNFIPNIFPELLKPIN
ncbi:SLC13 family permease [Marinigracilibium pacificum]|uniref:SLC13/DASS family transporter n=1 Tax=Marinigracilibium pacificum TaxID=2729599 RepID=A0A848J3K6_9BACT|nr:SLC13 family permease [Marinigracilibium pacificum]NMM49074.1 SLC13/DASS family transporter [Marinigracilibium pacificum]